MKSTYFSIVLASIGARSAFASNLPRQNNGTEGLRRLPGAQGVAVDGSNGAASPGLKPIPGSAVQVESLQPLLPLSSTGLANAGAIGQSVSVTLTSAAAAAAATLTSAVVLTTASSAVASAAPQGFFTIPNAAAGATSVASALENSATSVLTASTATSTASVQGFQPIVLSSSDALTTSSLELSVSSALTSALASVETSVLSQALATSELLSNSATAALTPLGGAGGAATATATATAAAANSPLQPLPGSAVAATGSLQPLNGAEGSAASTTAGLEPLSNAADSTGATSLKPLGGTETAASLQPLSSITGSAQSAATTFFQSGRAGASGTLTATNGLNSAVASSVVTAKAATNVMLSGVFTTVLAGLTAYLLL